ncbi:uncharacterized protein I303_103079 [Kwoniella dejecticola CBS 10117]|uniref:Uncharacterized protein n=1 Tax=Kwoniella dejecticola CBS 10117 TaxID=1296121 RepID=A0A1A6AAJ2_9TREE|nr:uncharacterized protein I303_03099 [Kwoniella dejecticola CBS 10117]OBR87076.1 hypothetical protein I303_03099 [Kwoniella dejecticola CBS 10117]
MIRAIYILLLLLFSLAGACLGQRATYQDEAGYTIVVTPTTDDYGNVFSVAVSTIYTSPTAKAGAKGSGSATQTSPSVPTTTSFRGTFTVTQGSIMDYSSYQSSVTQALNSMQTAAYMKYTATATGAGDKAGLYASSAVSARPNARLVQVFGVIVLFLTSLKVGLLTM